MTKTNHKKDSGPDIALSGYFIDLSEKEEKDLLAFLEENNYSRDTEGIKKFILDCVYEDEVAGKSNPFVNVIMENPELLTQAANSIGGYVKKKLFGGR